MFADISGFTAMSEKLDPEEVTSIMNRCFEALEGVVMAHGGEVNKYLGDCVLAVFGLEDDAAPSHRAVEAALEIRDTIYHFNRDARLDSPLDVHIGIDTGPVVASEIGGEVHRELTVTGEAVALAARLEDLSDKGQIFVGPDTHRTTVDEFDYRPLPPPCSSGTARTRFPSTNCSAPTSACAG